MGILILVSNERIGHRIHEQFKGPQEMLSGSLIMGLDIADLNDPQKAPPQHVNRLVDISFL